jgi:NAD(P)-dependent dehydrogenase (short-subunit alcohol dehydrogenase family)
VPASLEGKTCVVVGGGRGIGRLIADRLAAEGADLVLGARTRTEVERTAADIAERHSVDVVASPVDVTRPEEVAALAASVAKRRAAYALFNCAAVLGPVGRIDQVDVHRWRDAVMVNLVGTAVCCAAFVPQMAAAGDGVIVNFSGGGVGGSGLHGRISAYTAAKAGVVALTEGLSKELAEHGIRINAVAPGAIRTTFMDEVLAGGPERAGASLYETTVQQHDGPDHSDDLLAMVLFLVSPTSRAISGKFLSARWDDLSELGSHAAGASGSSLLTLRRIDDVLYREVPRPDGAAG